jgi:hypothetical protein
MHVRIDHPERLGNRVIGGICYRGLVSVHLVPALLGESGQSGIRTAWIDTNFHVPTFPFGVLTIDLYNFLSDLSINYFSMAHKVATTAGDDAS